LTVPGAEANALLKNSASNHSDRSIKIAEKAKEKQQMFNKQLELKIADNPPVSMTASNIEILSRVIPSKSVRTNTNQTDEKLFSQTLTI
jgi:hypothetical protein